MINQGRSHFKGAAKGSDGMFIEGKHKRCLSASYQPLLIGLTLLLTLAFLTSCSHVSSKHDGAPDFYVDETKIPDAVPKPEPLSKYGNLKSYRVFGKRYYPMKSCHHYEAVGTASWYGTKFHKHSTSSGEPYNMLAMTAAHKTLPLPTYVEVINLKNHRRIIVKVNDRGPFESNRLIDLSYVAAKKLGMIGHGTTKVRIRAINPYDFTQPRSFVQKQSSHHEGSLYFQVGAFRLRANAEKLQYRLTALLAAPVNIAVPGANSRLYRVKVGPMNDTAARNVATQLKHLGIGQKKCF